MMAVRFKSPCALVGLLPLLLASLQFLVMNQFNDFVEGDELISLYFGDNLTSITGTGLIVVIFYVVSLILLWVFLQPPRSLLRVFGDVPMIVVSG